MSEGGEGKERATERRGGELTAATEGWGRWVPVSIKKDKWGREEKDREVSNEIYPW